MAKLLNRKAEIVVLDRGHGTSCTVNLHGATITSWRVAYVEQLFISKDSVLDNMWPIRGGISVIFPKYNYEDINMPNHGFSRINKWSVRSEPQVLRNGDVVAELCLQENAIGAACYWQYDFRLVYRVVLRGHELRLVLMVGNSSTDTRFEYNAVFLACFKVSELSRCVFLGLKGCDFVDKRKLKTDKEERSVVVLNEWTDRIYVDVPKKIFVANVTESSDIAVTKYNMPDLVVWTPWTDKSPMLSHFVTQEYINMLCIQPGTVCTSLIVEPQSEIKSSAFFKIITHNKKVHP